MEISYLSTTHSLNCGSEETLSSFDGIRIYKAFFIRRCVLCHKTLAHLLQMNRHFPNFKIIFLASSILDFKKSANKDDWF